MADNSSIAFQIYKTIEEKQNELIKKNAIKPEDIQELSEENFINELHASVNFHTKNINNKAVISEIYKEILKQVDRISDVSQITTSSGIKLPDEIICEGVKLATERTKIEDVDNDLENNNSSNKLISQFKDIESLEEKINFYENLSDDEKKDVQREVYTNLFGSDIAQTIIEQENLQPLKENEAFNDLSETEQEEVIKIREANNPLKYIYESLGIYYSEGDYQFDKFGIVIGRLQETLEKKNEIDEGTFDTISKVLVDVLKFSKEDAEKFIKTFEKKYKNDPNFLKKNLEYKEHRKKIAEKYESEKEPLKYFVKKNGLGNYTELEDLIRDSFSEDGLNLNAFRVNLIGFHNQKDLPVSNFLKDGSRFSEEYYRAKEEYYRAKEENEALYPKGDSSLENLRTLEAELLENFNMDEMINNVEDIYGSAFKNNMLFFKSDLERNSIDKSLDVLYGIKSEELMVKQEMPEEEHTKESPDIFAEIIDFSAGIRSFGDGENKTITPSATIPDIRKLIEKQGHMEDIVATIGKISEIGKKGINSIEQEKNADGEKKDDQKTSAPSDEEKE